MTDRSGERRRKPISIYLDTRKVRKTRQGSVAQLLSVLSSQLHDSDETKSVMLDAAGPVAASLLQSSTIGWTMGLLLETGPFWVSTQAGPDRS